MITDEEMDAHIAAMTEMSRRMTEDLIEWYTRGAERATNALEREMWLNKLEDIREKEAEEARREARAARRRARLEELRSQFMAEVKAREARMAAASSPQDP